MAPDQPPSTPCKPPIIITTKWLQPAAEPLRTDVEWIADLPAVPEISYDEYTVDFESDDFLDFGGAEGKATISLTQTEFSLKQCAK
jgi:hypothetical protein